MTSSALPLLFVGLVIGALIGWLARTSYRPAQTPELSPAQQQQELAQQLGQDFSHDLAARVGPLEDALEKGLGRLGSQLQNLETQRASQLAALTGQIQAVSRTSARLGDRTDQLVTALRSPNVRGRWGELQLERVVEIGGMVKHVDFSPQQTAVIDGQTVRPDMVIKLSGGRHIVVDAKAPFSAYLDALETPDPEEHAAFLRRHAHHLRSHVNALAHKDYIEAFYPTPEFVVLFVPADPFLDAALSIDPELLEYALGRNVVLATPTTLFALLRTVALGWQQEDVSARAREVLRLGRELYTRLGTMSEHYNRVGRSLDKAVEAYNATLGSIDSRVLVTARRLADLGVPARSDKAPGTPDPVASRPRHAIDPEEMG